MATLLDASLISFLLPLFVFLFIFAVLYALLIKTELLGKNKALGLLVAICISAVAIFAGNLVKIIGSITPWIVFIIIVLFLIFGLYRFFGLENKEIWPTIGGPILVYVIILIVLLIGLVTVFEPEVSPYSSSDGPLNTTSDLAGKSVRSEALASLAHPRVLGAVFILIITALTAKILVDKTE